MKTVLDENSEWHTPTLKRTQRSQANNLNDPFKKLEKAK